ncbi:MAG: Gfo/Idh/MocA family oxidoreductase [Chloroflexi bacterium]|nr:Gfo/Idh/MocA family oxidoreductase [Chloroflexota bacterium]
MRQFKVAIVGAGMIGRLHARAFQAIESTFGDAGWRVELSVIADADEALTRDAQERWKIGRAVPSWRDVVEADDVDIAVVGLPNQDHRAAVEALVAAGKHVLCEKPLAPTVEAARSMLDAARRAGVVHGIGFNLRRAPAIAAIRQMLVDGAIGAPRHLSGHFFTDYAVSTAVPFTWRYQRSLAGSGALGDVGSHILDLARYLLGDIAAVTGATLATFIHERPVPAAHVTGHNIGPTTGQTGKVDTDDSGAFTCRFASGAIGDIRFSRVAPGHRGPAFDLIGSEGAISFDMRRPGEFGICSAPPGRDAVGSGFRRLAADPRFPYGSDLVAPIGFDYVDTYVAQAYEFLSAVAQQRQYEPGFEDGFAIAEVCETVQRLADSG